MEVAVLYEWVRVRVDYLKKLANSMPKRLTLCIKAKGGSIKY